MSIFPRANATFTQIRDGVHFLNFTQSCRIFIADEWGVYTCSHARVGTCLLKIRDVGVCPKASIRRVLYGVHDQSIIVLATADIKVLCMV